MNDLIKKWEALADGLEEDALSAGFKEHAIKWEAEMSALRKCAAELRAMLTATGTHCEHCGNGACSVCGRAA